MNACVPFVGVPLQCWDKTLLYCDNLPTNYTCPPFSGPVSVLPYFQVLLFQSTRIQLSMLSNESSLVLWGTVYTSYDCAIAHTGYRINQIMLWNATQQEELKTTSWFRLKPIWTSAASLPMRRYCCLSTSYAGQWTICGVDCTPFGFLPNSVTSHHNHHLFFQEK